MAIKANLVIAQGTTFNADIDLVDSADQIYDLTGYTVASQMRKNYTSSAAVTFTCTTNGSGGKIFLSLNADLTSTIEPGRYLYDVEITSPGGVKTRVVEGIVTVTPGMTRI
jgi:hypothetical protein